MTRRLRVAVVGAGVGGLTTAAALRRAGIEVAVHDRARALDAAGAGLQLAPNATRLLARLGVPRHLAAGRAVGCAAVDLRHGVDGRLLARTELGPACVARYGAPHVTVARAELQAALLAAAGPERVALDRTLVRVVDDGAAAGLEFADGTTAEADAVVGADGIRSAVRRHLGGADPVPSRHDVLRALAPGDGADPRVTVWAGPGRHCVHYPVAGRERVSVAAIVPAREPRAWSAPAPVADVLDAFAGWHPALRGLLAAAGPWRRFALHDLDPLPAWSRGRVTLLGDAAHAMLPFLAQGANQAVEDALALAAVLRGATPGEVAARLRRYDAVRRPRADAVARTSRAVAARLHAEPEPGPVDGHRGLGELAWLYGHDAEAAAPASHDPGAGRDSVGRAVPCSAACPP